MAFINQDRKTSIQSDRLNLKQTPADIWEYDDANTDSTPTLSLKSPWKFSGEFRPPIGIPTLWFLSLPDWALAFDDGSGPYLWEDYPELDTAAFKAMLAPWSTAGWMSAYDASQFYVPDLRGMALQIAGTNAVRMMANGSGYDGGDVGDYDADMMFSWQLGAKADGSGVVNLYGWASERNNTSTATPVTAYTMMRLAQSGQGSNRKLHAMDDGINGSPNLGAKTKPATASIRLIVRFK